MIEPIASPNYPRAPIIEAVIELRVREIIEPDDVKKIAERLKRRYDFAEEQKLVETSAGFDANGMLLNYSITESRRLSTSDQDRVAVVNQRSLVTSRLPPYREWATLRDDARANWQDWKHVVRSSIERVGVRFINRIDIPTNGTDTVRLEQYLTVYPQMAAYQRPSTNFLVQTSMDGHVKNWQVNVTVAPYVPPPVPDHLAILLDIDVFRTDEIPAREDDFWAIVDEARSVKNDVFERTVTPLAKELFS